MRGYYLTENNVLIPIPPKRQVAQQQEAWAVTDGWLLFGLLVVGCVIIAIVKGMI